MSKRWRTPTIGLNSRLIFHNLLILHGGFWKIPAYFSEKPSSAWWFQLLWKIWVRQLGLWHSQYMESHKIPWFQTTNQSWSSWIRGCWSPTNLPIRPSSRRWQRWCQWQRPGTGCCCSGCPQDRPAVKSRWAPGNARLLEVKAIYRSSVK